MMFKKLRIWLTFICALGTSLVLILMAYLGLRFSLERLRQQQAESFNNNVSTVLFYLQSRQAIDHTWLARTEAQNHLYIGISSRQTSLLYTKQNPVRQQLVDEALRQAVEYHGFVEDNAPKNNLETETLVFEANLNGVDYRVAVSKLPYNHDWLTVVVLKDKVAEYEVARGLVLIYISSIAAGVFLLAAFSWFFTGRALRPAEISQKKQTEFLAAASHELRSPLAVIRMCAGSIKSIPEKAPDYADKIERECERMSRLISDLLLLAGSDNSRLQVVMENVSAKTLALTSFERFEGLAAKKGIQLVLDLPAQPLPDVLCDRQRIEQLLAVLLDNALSYTPQGGDIRLRVYAERHKVRFTVEDSGPGVADEYKQLIFERFYQQDSSRSTKEHYGLGLSVAQELTRLHKGKLVVTDSPLGGASFVLSLPASGNESH